MFKVEMLSMVTSEYSEHMLPSSAYMRKLESIGRSSDGVILVDQNFAESEAVAVITEDLLDYTAHGIEHNGKLYVPFAAGSSQIRKATTMWIDRSIYGEIGKWCMCGLKGQGMVIAPNKYCAYIGLLFSSTRLFSDVFGRVLDLDKICVVNDVMNEIEGSFWDVDDTDVTPVHKKIENNASDGMAFIRRELTGDKAFTLRMPWVKAACFPSDIKHFAETRNVSTIVKDVFGNDVDLAEMDIILTTSCFKTWGQYKDQFGSEGWEVYKRNFRALGHDFGVCVQEHNAKLPIPYQQLQTLVAATDEDIAKLYGETVGQIDYSDSQEAVRLLPGSMREAAKLYPAFMNEEFTMSSIQNGYASKRRAFASGRVPRIARSPFVAPDPIAIMEGMLGLPVRGVLKPGFCSCNLFKYGNVDITRSPHLDNAHCVRMNRRIMNRYFIGNTMYISVFDKIVKSICADFDGDHVNVTQNDIILDLADRTHKLLHDQTLDYPAGKAPKKPMNANELRGFFNNLTKAAPVGLYANGATKVWAHFDAERGFDYRLMSQLTKGANTCIDAAKHSEGGQDDAGQQDAPYDLVKDYKLPRHLVYAKANFEDEDDVRAWMEKTQKTNGVVDRWCGLVLEAMPEKLEISGLEEVAFDWHMLTRSNTPKIIAGLINDDRNCVFRRIAYRKSDEWANLFPDKDSKAHAAEWEHQFAAEARAEIAAYCANIRSNNFPEGATLEDACDAIAMYCYRVVGVKAIEQLKRTLWSVFGDMIVANIRARLNVTDPDGEDFMDYTDDDLFIEE